MFKDIISAPRMFKDPRIMSNGKYRYRLIYIDRYLMKREREKREEGYLCNAVNICWITEGNKSESPGPAGVRILHHNTVNHFTKSKTR